MYQVTYAEELLLEVDGLDVALDFAYEQAKVKFPCHIAIWSEQKFLVLVRYGDTDLFSDLTNQRIREKYLKGGQES